METTSSHIPPEGLNTVNILSEGLQTVNMGKKVKSLFRNIVVMSKEKIRRYHQYYRAYSLYNGFIKGRNGYRRVNVEFIKNSRISAYNKEFIEYSRFLPPFEVNLTDGGNMIRYLQYYIMHNLVIDIDSGIDRMWDVFAQIDANPFKLNSDIDSPEHPKNVERYKQYIEQIKIVVYDRLMTACEEKDKLWEDNHKARERDTSANNESEASAPGDETNDEK
jgi:hypothetical protein